jgi:methionine-rich copper-binding protein CopC
MFALTLIAAVGLLFFAGISPASAHARLISSSPANGQSLTQGPTEIVLTFDQPVTVQTLRATSDDGTEVQLGTPVISGNTVTTPWPGGQKPGIYRLGYVMNSQDGHAVEGLMLFTYATASPGTPPAPADSGSSTPWIPIAIGIAALTALGAGVALWLRNRSSVEPVSEGNGRHAAPAAMPTVDSTVGSPAQHEPTA